MIVEDDYLIANSIKKGLEQEKYIVDVAYEGLEGYDLAGSNEYEVIILDLMLPGMDGLEICKKLREDKIKSGILILTARGQIEDKVLGLNSGADDYLAKPFAFEELLARIKAIGRRPKIPEKNIYKIADLSMNTTNFEVKRGHKKIQLSAKEYALLECLMRHKGQILNKEQLIERVWNYESNILPNTVEVYIRNLRKKIDKNNKVKLIKTRRGFGYKIEVENV